MSKELKEGDIIPFIRSKDYKFIQNLGLGSFSKTVLLKDEITDELYACKKYDPIEQINGEKEKEEYFEKFIDEIKILNKIVHHNIVRIYNNYIYPKEKVGYIIMEYVENAKEIGEYIKNNSDKINGVFEQIIEGFSYLEKMKLCHRDIRSKNILIDSNGIVKIIDFGFGKNYILDETVSPSTLYKNGWIVNPPSEMNTMDDNKPIYNNKTEVYFVGHLIKQIVEENCIKSFRYIPILNEMIEFNEKNRIKSFEEIKNRMAENSISSKSIFTKEDKEVYQKIVSKLDEIIDSVELDARVNDINTIIEKLEKINLKYNLEDKILNNKDFAECFFENVVNVNENSTEWSNYDGEPYEVNMIPTSLITQSIQWLRRCNEKQKELKYIFNSFAFI